jgi:hypothetical protein
MKKKSRPLGETVVYRGYAWTVQAYNADADTYVLGSLDGQAAEYNADAVNVKSAP